MWQNTVFQPFLLKGICETQYIDKDNPFYIVPIYDYLLLGVCLNSLLCFVHFCRISITFRKMDESKWPVGFTPEPDLQGLQPLSYEVDRSKHSNISKINRPSVVQSARSENNRDILKERGLFGPGPQREGPLNRQRLRLDLEH